MLVPVVGVDVLHKRLDVMYSSYVAGSLAR
jgi:hypothetical protein